MCKRLLEASGREMMMASTGRQQGWGDDRFKRNLGMQIFRTYLVMERWGQGRERVRGS